MLIDVFSDVICPWCYIGKRRLAAAIAADPVGDIQVAWRAYQLYPAIPAEGMDRDEFVARRFGPGGGGSARSEAFRRIADEGAKEGIEFNFGAQRRMPNTLGAHRLIALAQDALMQDTLVETLFRFNFTEGQDVGDLDVLADAAEIAGLDRDAARAYLADPAAGRDAVLAEIAFARDADISGVPNFILQRKFSIPGAQDAQTLGMFIQRARERLSA